MFYYIYILLSLKNHSLYIGYTTDLIKRFKQHNNREGLATRPFRQYKSIQTMVKIVKGLGVSIDDLMK